MINYITLRFQDWHNLIIYESGDTSTTKRGHLGLGFYIIFEVIDEEEIVIMSSIFFFCSLAAACSLPAGISEIV